MKNSRPSCALCRCLHASRAHRHRRLVNLGSVYYPVLDPQPYPVQHATHTRPSTNFVLASSRCGSGHEPSRGMIPTINNASEGPPHRTRSASTFSTTELHAPPPAPDPSTSTSHGPYTLQIKSDIPTVPKMRKRHSFFGRTTPDDDSITSGMSALHATISSQGRDSPAAPRPGTASSERPRRKTEHFETIRNSIFGRRKKTNPSISSARLSTQPQSFSTPTDGPLPGRAELARAHFKTEDDCTWARFFASAWPKLEANETH